MSPEVSRNPEQKNKANEQKEGVAPTKLPVEELVQRQGEALGKVINYLKANEIKQKQNIEIQKAKIEERKAWQQQAKEAQVAYNKASIQRKGVINAAGYLAIGFGISGIYNILNTAITGGVLPDLPSFAGLLLAPVFRPTAWYQAIEKKINDHYDNKNPEFHYMNEIMDKNPDDPKNQNVSDDIAKFENGNSQANEKKQTPNNQEQPVAQSKPVNMLEGRQAGPSKPNTVSKEVPKVDIPPEVMELIQKAKASQEAQKRG